jgi:hypothetical protein
VRGGTLAKADRLESAISGIKPAEQALALGREPDRSIGGGGKVMQADAGADREIFCPERAFLRKPWPRGEEGGGARGKKLAAIHGVTPTVSD